MESRVPKISFVLMLILTFITYGIYYPVWCLRRVEWINSLSSEKKLGYGLPMFVLIAYSISAFILLLVFFTEDVAFVAFLDMLDSLITLAGVIVVLVIAFKIRRIFIEHYQENLRLDMNFSGILTFLFTFLYLQFEMNRVESASVLPDQATIERDKEKLSEQEEKLTKIRERKKLGLD